MHVYNIYSHRGQTFELDCVPSLSAVI